MIDIRKWVLGKRETEKLYLRDSYLRTCEAILLDYVNDRKNKYYVILDRTIFHPRGGGQPSDVGMITGANFEFQVKKALSVNNVVVHYGILMRGNLEKKIPVKCILDWNRRYYIMRLHTAGHILDHALREVYSRVVDTVSAEHGPPKPYVEYRAESPTQDVLLNIEEIANHTVKEAKQVRVIFTDREQLNKYVVNAPNIDRLPPADIYRIVVIEDVNAIPCTGTHVANTREVGKNTCKGSRKNRQWF